MKHYLLSCWIPVALAGSVIMLTLFVTLQQNIRMSGNDPQIQLAEDGAAYLSNGSSPYGLLGNTHVDMEKSLAPFMIIFDDAGKLVASSGYFNVQVPIPPSGVFDYARTHADDRITWQPASTTRVAAVVQHFQNKISGFVVAGRNMRELEDRESQLQFIIIVAWVGMLFLSFIAVVFAWAMSLKSGKESERPE